MGRFRNRMVARCSMNDKSITYPVTSIDDLNNAGFRAWLGGWPTIIITDTFATVRSGIPYFLFNFGPTLAEWYDGAITDDNSADRRDYACMLVEFSAFPYVAITLGGLTFFSVYDALTGVAIEVVGFLTDSGGNYKCETFVTPAFDHDFTSWEEDTTNNKLLMTFTRINANQKDATFQFWDRSAQALQTYTTSYLAPGAGDMVPFFEIGNFGSFVGISTLQIACTPIPYGDPPPFGIR